MANELHVDADGLRTAAAASETDAATALNHANTGNPTPQQPSGTGVAAVNAALAALQARQTQRITGQAGDLATSSARYDTTDGDGANAITTVSV